MEKNIEQKLSKLFSCQLCDYTTSRKLNYDRHKLSAKHQKNEIESKNEQIESKIEQIEQDDKITILDPTHMYQCICGNTYKYSRGLLKHKSVCPSLYKDESNLKMLTNLVLEVVKQNKELITQHNEVQKQNQELTTKLVEISSKGANNMQINHTNNNNTFNLNVFLNEQCKDAMNIMDFVDSLQIQLSDLEAIGKFGFVEGISNLIVRNLKALDVTQRPIHCADKKREIIYVKDQDKWEKENDQKLKIRKAIKRVATKNQKLLPKYKEKHPGCNYSESEYANQYSKLVIEVMDDNNTDKQDKIIRKIANEVVIDKRFQ